MWKKSSKYEQEWECFCAACLLLWHEVFCMCRKLNSQILLHKTNNTAGTYSQPVLPHKRKMNHYWTYFKVKMSQCNWAIGLFNKWALPEVKFDKLWQDIVLHPEIEKKPGENVKKALKQSFLWSCIFQKLNTLSTFTYSGVNW